ncbi:unnamed protein product [Durusdinium trenchii]|uniref:Uncharacterized protein n=2 Tax=Durusdinium trenchii TaxID=1381693 RepID=A0ABP0JR09_9DINO
MANSQTPYAFRVESPPRSIDCVNSSSSLSSAVALRGRSFSAERFATFQSGPPVDRGGWHPFVFLGVALLLSASMSGGLIFGSSPFEEALLRDCGYGIEDATAVWGRGFQVFVVGTAISSPFLDYMGPRWFASLGLCVECFGHHILAGTASYSRERGRKFVPFGYGMVGIGGNMLMLASVQFSQLFDNSCTVAAILSGAYQFAGFIFTILAAPSVDFRAFFEVYQFITLAGLCLTLLCYPDEPYGPQRLGRCTWPSLPKCCKDSSARTGRAIGLQCCSHLGKLRTWLFLLSFAWGATSGGWCTGAFLGEVSKKAEAEAQSPVATKPLVAWMPFLSNATFFFTPGIGALIDSWGFVPAIHLLCVAVLASVLSLVLLPLAWQWLTLLSLNWLQAVTYTLQFTYIARKYAPDQFGTVMALSTLVQSAVNLVGLYLLTSRPLVAATILIFPCICLCQLWHWKERREQTERRAMTTMSRDESAL